MDYFNNCINQLLYTNLFNKEYFDDNCYYNLGNCKFKYHNYFKCYHCEEIYKHLNIENQYKNKVPNEISIKNGIFSGEKIEIIHDKNDNNYWKKAVMINHHIYSYFKKNRWQMFIAKLYCTFKCSDYSHLICQSVKGITQVDSVYILPLLSQLKIILDIFKEEGIYYNSDLIAIEQQPFAYKYKNIEIKSPYTIKILDFNNIIPSSKENDFIRDKVVLYKKILTMSEIVDKEKIGEWLYNDNDIMQYISNN